MSTTKLFRTGLTLLAFLMLFTPLAEAHKPNQNYIYLSIYENEIDCRVELRKSDIEQVFGFEFEAGEYPDSNDPQTQTMVDYILENLKFSSASGDHELIFTGTDILDLGGNDFILFNFDLSNIDSIPSEMDIYDEIFLQEISGHESLLHIERNWKTGVLANEALPSLIYGPASTNQTLDIEEGSVFTGFMAMVKSGIYHIWIGLDHILFLFSNVFSCRCTSQSLTFRYSFVPQC